MSFLASRVSSGTKLDTLVISDSPDMPSGVEGDIKGMVRESKIDDSKTLLRRLFASPGP